jgi:hypothetical protein
MGLLVESESFNAKVRSAVEGDFSGTNSWKLDIDGTGNVVWSGDGEVLTAQPANSFMHRIEDWFFSLLPLEQEL